MRERSRRKSSISRVVIMDEVDRGSFLDFFEMRFKERSVGSIPSKRLPQELLGLLPELNICMSAFLNKYGVDYIEILPDNILIVDISKLTKHEKSGLEKNDRIKAGSYDYYWQHILMYKDYEPDRKMEFLLTLVHEMLHFNSFQSSHLASFDIPGHLNFEGQYKGQRCNIGLNMRRIGLRIFNRAGNMVFFDGVDEAVIAELTKRFDREYFSRFSQIADEYQERQNFLNELPEENHLESSLIQEELAFFYRDGDRGDVDLKDIIVGYSKPDERASLNEKINQVYEKNKSIFPSREEIFSLFARAAMSGRLLPVARIIERTYGRGSFRIIGEEASRDRGMPKL